MGTKNDLSKFMMFDNVDPALLLDLDANTIGNSNNNWVDLSQYQRSVTSSAGRYPALTADVFGVGNYGYFFDGTDLFSVPDSDDLSFCTATIDLPYSMLFQVRINTSYTGQQYLICKLGTQYEYELLLINGTIYWNMNSASGFIASRKPYTFTNSGIYEIVFTYDATNKQNGTNIYINKTLQTGLTRILNNYTHMINTTANVLIGGGTGSLQGYLGKCKIWNKCLTQTEINNL